MSIQGSINQALSVGALLYTQSAKFAAKKQEKLDKKEVAKIDKGLSNLDEQNKANYAKLSDELDENMARATLDPGEKGDSARAKIKAAQTAYNEINKYMQDSSLDLLKRKADLTGDYSDYTKRKYEYAKNKAFDSLIDAQNQKRNTKKSKPKEKK